MPQLITVRNIVDSCRLAIKEARLQAFLDPKDFNDVNPVSGAWKHCVNILGDVSKNMGCAMGVTYNAETRAKLVELSAMYPLTPTGVLAMAGGTIEFKTNSQKLIATRTQLLHDFVAVKFKFKFQSANLANNTIGIHEIDDFHTDGPPTTSDFKRWLDILDKYAEEIDAKAA